MSQTLTAYGVLLTQRFACVTLVLVQARVYVSGHVALEALSLSVAHHDKQYVTALEGGREGGSEE